MPRDYRVYLHDILDAIAKIRQFTAGYALDDLAHDAKTLDAVVRNLEVLGEAVRCLRRIFGRGMRISDGKKWLGSEIF